MELELNVRHGVLNDAVREAVVRKLRRLERKLSRDVSVVVTLDRERNPRIVDDHVIEAEVSHKSLHAIGKAVGPTYEVATDRVVEALDRQIDRHREKKIREPRRRGARIERMPSGRAGRAGRAGSALSLETTEPYPLRARNTGVSAN